MFSMVTTTSSRLFISELDMLDMELSLLRLAWWDILRLPGLLGLLSTLPPPDSWVRTPGVERDLGRDIFSSVVTWFVYDQCTQFNVQVGSYTKLQSSQLLRVSSLHSTD